MIHAGLPRWMMWCLLAGAVLLLPAVADAEPIWEHQVARVLLLQDYNTRVVVVGATLLGAASGLVGTFLVLRRRALLSDAISHATLPGVAIAFLALVMLGQSGKSLPVLLLGAAVAGTIGMLTVSIIRAQSRIKDDAAIGIVLSVFFGIGIVLLGFVTRMETGGASGLKSFIYGKTASMLMSDAMLIGASAFVAGVACVFLHKEFSLVCFDPDYAASEGWPIFRLDVLMMSLVVLVTVIGLQAVGLILVVALIVIPPSAARFWTFRLGRMLFISAVIGAASAWIGAALSALLANLPSGAVIVLTAAGFFFVSLLFGTARGIVWSAVRHWRLSGSVTRQHLLRAIYEAAENGVSGTVAGDAGAPEAWLLERRSWTRRRLLRSLRNARRAGLVTRNGTGNWVLTERGLHEARRVVRNHRLWELYMVHYADIATTVVDRNADRIEHVLDEGLVARLESLLAEQGSREDVPRSPHLIPHPEGAR